MINLLSILLLGFVIGLFYSRGKSDPPHAAWCDLVRVFRYLYGKVSETIGSGRESKFKKKESEIIDV